MSEHCQIHFLRLGDLLRNNLSGLDELCLELQRWMQLWALGSKLEEKEMSAMLQDVPEVQAAYAEYRKFTADPKMRERIEARERFLNAQYLDRADARAEGRAERDIEVAKNMKKKGYPINDIAELTGLSLSEIERLD
jgi:predicted transposase/invertase (TIGR01784 family)